MPGNPVPPVTIEEASFRTKPIAGVSTCTAAFVGMTRSGPFAIAQGDGAPPLLTS